MPRSEIIATRVEILQAREENLPCGVADDPIRGVGSGAWFADDRAGKPAGLASCLSIGSILTPYFKREQPGVFDMSDHNPLHQGRPGARRGVHGAQAANVVCAIILLVFMGINLSLIGFLIVLIAAVVNHAILEAVLAIFDIADDAAAVRLSVVGTGDGRAEKKRSLQPHEEEAEMRRLIAEEQAKQSAKP
jgi:hypothetical protein